MTDENEKSELEARMAAGLRDFLEANKIDGINFKPGKIDVNMDAVKKARQIDENDAAVDAINEAMVDDDHKPINETNTSNTVTGDNVSKHTMEDNPGDKKKDQEDAKTSTDSADDGVKPTDDSRNSIDDNDDNLGPADDQPPVDHDNSPVETTSTNTIDNSDVNDKTDDSESNKNDDHSEDDDHTSKSVWRQFFLSWRGVVAVVIIIIAMIIPALWVEIIQPAIDKKQLEQQASESTAAIVPYAHKWEQVKLDTNKTGKLAVNTKQWLLTNTVAVDGMQTSCMVFHAKDRPETGHMAKVTLAFGDSKSRDFMNAQASTFETAMRQGKIDLQVCMLLTSDEYSAFALETLGEVDFNDYTNTWEALKNLLKVDETSFTNADSRIKAALNAINNITDVDKKVNISSDSIKNGSFIQWSKVMTDANKVEKIPAFWLDGVNLSNQDKFNMDNPDAMWTKLNALK